MYSKLTLIPCTYIITMAYTFCQYSSCIHFPNNIVPAVLMLDIVLIRRGGNSHSRSLIITESMRNDKTKNCNDHYYYGCCCR
jgi:hypothetical protein